MRDINWLQMFAEGGDGGEGAAPDAGTDNAQAATTGEIPSAAGKKGKNRRENPLANVKFGIDPNSQAQKPAVDANQTAQETGAAQNAPQEEESFESLIKGKYKADFDARVQDIIGKRFKGNKADRERLESLEPMLQLLASNHGIDLTAEDGVKKLIEAVQDDDKYYEEEAERRGMSVRATKEIVKLEKANERAKNAEAERAKAEAERAAEEQRIAEYNKLCADTEEIKKVYPGFDLSSEMRNDDFMRLIANHVPARTAYEVVHRDEIMRGGMQYAAQKAAQQVSNAVRANAARPTEGALGNASTAQVQITDPRKLTHEMRKELRERVRRGEKIYW